MNLQLKRKRGKRKTKLKDSAQNVLKESLKSLTSAQKLIKSARTAPIERVRKRKKRKWNLKSKIIPRLRQIWFFSPERAEAVKRANGSCEKCSNKLDKLVADHIQPIVDPDIGFVDWNTYISRMFCGANGLQILCKGCHDEKSKKENEKRKNVRRALQNVSRK